MNPAKKEIWVILAIVFLVALFLFVREQTPKNQNPVPPDSRRDYLFFFWNVENLFDDQEDDRTGPGDKEYDPWLARNPHILREKLDKLAEVILSQQEGQGPDILGMVEVESLRAAQLLQKTLNDRLEPALQYNNLLMKEVKGGRHIAPVLLTRLPAVHDRTRLLGSRQRILQSTLVVDGNELAVIVSHWSSRLKETAEKGRSDYADKIYGACNAMYHNNPAVDIVVCGDFNDTPDDASVIENLHATRDRNAVLSGPPLRLFNLMAGKDPAHGFGTHYYHREWSIFDQIVVSPGMLDQQGWMCEPDTIRTINTFTKPGDPHHRPWRFGGEKEKGPRGYSDHFPVTTRLKVQG